MVPGAETSSSGRWPIDADASLLAATAPWHRHEAQSGALAGGVNAAAGSLRGFGEPMTATGNKFRLELLGGFRLFAPDGTRITISAKRSRVLLAMLATDPYGERSRIWLQDRIWGTRDRAQAQASLRRELANLRPLLNGSRPPVLVANHEAVALDLSRIDLDIRDPGVLARSRGEFLAGIDLAREEGFEDWLREERQALHNECEAAAAYGASAVNASDAGPALERMGGGGPRLAVAVEPQDLPSTSAAIVEGIAYDLAERIARLRWLTVIGSPVATLPSDRPEALERTGALLGTDYLLHCRMAAGRMFQVALSETADGRLLWSSRYALGEPVAAAELEQVETDAVAALAMQIETNQQQRVRDRQVHQLSADELVWRARWHMRRLTREDARIAEELLATAAAARPDSAEIMIERGYAEAWRLWSQGAPRQPIEDLRQRITVARDIDPHHARAWLLLGILDMWLSRHDRAASLMREAIRLNPSLSYAYGHLGSCHSLAGRPQEALPLIRTALRLNPLDTQNFHQFGELALAHFMLGDREGAVAEADNALSRRPGYAYAHVIKIAALAGGGDNAAAARAADALLRVRPNYEPAALEWLPFADRQWNARLRDAVERALEHARRPMRAVS